MGTEFLASATHLELTQKKIPARVLEETKSLYWVRAGGPTLTRAVRARARARARAKYPELFFEFRYVIIELPPFSRDFGKISEKRWKHAKTAFLNLSFKPCFVTSLI